MTSRRSLLSPDFGTSNFSARAANPDSPPTTGGKKVKFARQLTNEYKIASRYDANVMPVSMEELANRLVRMRQDVKKECRKVRKLERMEASLLAENEFLFERFAPKVTLMQYNKSIVALEAKMDRLNEEITDMKVETLRYKGRRQSLTKVIDENRTKICAYSISPIVTSMESLWSSRNSLVSECA